MNPSQPAVERQATALVVPFSYERPFQTCLQEMDESLFEAGCISGDRLFEHVSHFIAPLAGRRPESIGLMWKLKQSARSRFALPHRQDTPLTCVTKDDRYEFAVRSIELYLFESQVGFLVLHITFPIGTLTARMIEALYYIKKLTQWNHAIQYERKLSKIESRTEDLHLGELTRRMIEPLHCATFFEGGTKQPGEALVFTSALLERPCGKDRSLLSEYLFRLRRSFKATYKPSEVEQDWKENPDILPLFENSVWGVSLEGVCNLVTKTADETADRFFSSTYYGNVENTYFPLYLLALHQKYALLALSNEAAGLPAQLASCNEDPLEQNRLLTSLKKKIADFLLRSSYKQVSNVTHHADFYSFVRSRLRIDELFAELREALEALASLTELAEEKQRRAEEERRRERSERFNRKITAITAIYLPLTVAISIFGLDLGGADWRLFAGCAAMLYGFTYALFRYWLNK